jgi:hypothetical protein
MPNLRETSLIPRSPRKENTMKFILHDSGDMSVGIWPYTATVEVTRTPDPDFTGDEIEALKVALSTSLMDGGVVATEAEWAAEAAAENAQIENMMDHEHEE